MIKDQPISEVQWIPIQKVYANDYNPNSVATQEMKLLYVSVKKDGYTQPVVTIYDEKKDRYVIVDGFHRYSIMRRYKDIYDSCEGKLPCVVLKGKTMNDRMASTIRHNRARGKHSVTGMSNIVMEMLMNGASDLEICNELGMEEEEHEVSQEQREKLYAEFVAKQQEEAAKRQAEQKEAMPAMTTEKAIERAVERQHEEAAPPPKYYKCVCEKCGHVMFVNAADLWNPETGDK